VFHVKHRRPLLAALPLLALGLLAIACAGAASPRGWAPPVVDRDLVLVSTNRGRLDAIDASGLPLWRFPDSFLFPVKGAGSAPPAPGSLPQLATAITPDATTVQVTTTSGLKKDIDALIGDEIVRVTAVQGSFLTLQRGPQATSHAQGERVVHVRNKPETALQGIYGPPVIDGNIIYVGDYSGYVYAIQKPATPPFGRVLWFRKLPGPVVGGVVLDPSRATLFATSDNGRVFALKTDDGTDRMPPLPAANRLWGRPLIDGGTLFVPAGDGRLFAYAVQDGRPAWPAAFEAGGALLGTPGADSGSVIVGSFDDRLYAVDKGSGALKWSHEGGHWFWSTPLVRGDVVYAANFDGSVYALRAASGAPLWARPFDAGGAVRAAPVLFESSTANTLVVVTTSGDLWGIDAATGAAAFGPVRLGEPPNSQGTTVQADLVLVDDRVYVLPTRCTEQAQADGSALKVNYFTFDLASRSLRAALDARGC
jgi:outer membrane protein assembly factor BamB